MKKNFLSFILLFSLSNLFAATGDTTVVVAHPHTNLASPPTNYDEWVVFLNSTTTYQKILMKFTLGCGTPQCSGWDYTVNTSLGKKTGTLDSSIVAIDTIAHDTTWSFTDHVRFTEIGRLITPYGTYMANSSNGFNNSWTHPYYYDVTDYATLLKDSVKVRVHYDGWSDAFSARVEFIFIEGEPTRTVQNVQEIYNGYFGYNNSADFENQVNVKTFYIHPQVTSAKVNIIMTGHGSQGEFDPHYLNVKVNSTEIYEHILWKDDCDINAVSPQGGTWVFPRANWCPGDKVPMFEADITPYITPGQNAAIDLDFDDYAVLSGQQAGYGISAYLITYSTQKDNDVMMEEIIAPNSDKPYLHGNPICTQPKVKIKNMGKQNLTYTDIKYWVKGGTYWYYEWQGNLPPFESEIITLPAFDWFGMDTNDRVFYAEARWPNGFEDEFSYNNRLQSAFNMAPQLDSVFYIYFKTNNHPEENWYTVKNENGDTIRFKSYTGINTAYRDTLHLAPGSYAFDMFDLDTLNWGSGDGISWWLNTQNGYENTGQLKLNKLNNTAIKTFNGDFGGNIHYEFTVGYPLGFNHPKTAPTEPVHHTGIIPIENNIYNMLVFPNPASDFIQVQVDLLHETPGTIELNDIAGRNIRSINVDASLHPSAIISTNGIARGMYFVSFITNGIKTTKRVAVQGEYGN